MKFTTTFAVLLLSASSILAAPLEVVTRDVWAPKVLKPTHKSVWHAGTSHKVQWALDKKPKTLTNSVGTIFLSKNGHLNTTHPLAKGFSLTSGSVNVTIPKGTPTGSDYTIVLMGVSGPKSQKFKIQV